MWDEGQYRIFGVTPETFSVSSANIQALLHPEDADQFGRAIAAFNTGARAYEGEFRVTRPDGEVRWCVGTAAATVDGSGRVVRVSGVTVDITERKRAEERQNLLAREVDHRAKNALALAQSIVRLTRADEVKAYVNAVEGRINALARVHTILSLSSWQGAELSKLVDEELAPYSLAGQIELAGPKVQLLPTTAQTLALALHELCTNSAKYGALSTRSGRLTIGWQAENELLTLTWEESGGPPVRTPKSRGFGTRSLLASVESQLGGQAQFDWRAEGLLCRLEVPLTRKTAAPGAQDKFDPGISPELQRASG
jgi:PAS domain S-box-containing protein